MLVWMDLEMTGLEPDRDVIVEMATLVTDDELKIVAEGPDLVIHSTPDKLASMDQAVRRMHTKSGLLTLIEESTVSLADAAAATIEFLKAQGITAGTAPLCGNSIGMDRRFLARHAPELENFLHYRSIDVSSVKELCRRWNPVAYGNAPKKLNGHRAMDDIRESVAELAYYRRCFFQLPQVVSSPGAAEPAGSPGTAGVADSHAVD